MADSWTAPGRLLAPGSRSGTDVPRQLRHPGCLATDEVDGAACDGASGQWQAFGGELGPGLLLDEDASAVELGQHGFEFGEIGVIGEAVFLA